MGQQAAQSSLGLSQLGGLPGALPSWRDCSADRQTPPAAAGHSCKRWHPLTSAALPALSAGPGCCKRWHPLTGAPLPCPPGIPCRRGGGGQGAGGLPRRVGHQRPRQQPLPHPPGRQQHGQRLRGPVSFFCFFDYTAHPTVAPCVCALRCVRGGVSLVCTASLHGGACAPRPRSVSLSHAPLALPPALPWRVSLSHAPCRLPCPAAACAATSPAATTRAWTSLCAATRCAAVLRLLGRWILRARGLLTPEAALGGAPEMLGSSCPRRSGRSTRPPAGCTPPPHSRPTPVTVSLPQPPPCHRSRRARRSTRCRWRSCCSEHPDQHESGGQQAVAASQLRLPTIHPLRPRALPPSSNSSSSNGSSLRRHVRL